jgi:hypothetical protein
LRFATTNVRVLFTAEKVAFPLLAATSVQVPALMNFALLVPSDVTISQTPGVLLLRVTGRPAEVVVDEVMVNSSP